MTALRAILTGTALGLLLGIGALTPAHAADSARYAVTADTVQGQPWSAPAYPIDCRITNGQISCTPLDPSSVVAQQCFMQVLVAGDGVTVCTTFADHTDAIQAAGGTPLLVEYGCSIGDVVCVTFENAGRGLALSATGMMFVVAENMRFDTSSLLWTAAVTEWSFWQWAILMILLGAMIWAIAAAIVSGDREQFVGALVRSFIAIPALPLTLWLTGHLLNAIDDMTWYILSRDGAGSLFATLQGVMWAGGQANYFFAFVIHGLLMIAMLLLMLVFAFRNIVLAALIAVGPIAWMIFPVRGIGPQWVVRYVSAVTVLLLTGPLTIGFVTLIINGLSTVQTIWDPRSWPLLVGLVLVAFAPFAIFGLFSFVGAVAADSVGSGAASHAGRMGSSAARTAVRIPSRFGASPAGMAGGGVAGRAAGSSSRGLSSSSAKGASGPAGSGPKPSQSPASVKPGPSTSPSPSPSSPPQPAQPASAGGSPGAPNGPSGRTSP